MKKLVSLILIFMVIMTISIASFATDVLDDDNTTTITGNEYENAQQNVLNDNNNNNSSVLPQTGSQDYAVAILFVVFAAGAVFAYKKVSDYRDI